MVAGVGIEPTTRGFSKFHRQLIRKYFNHLCRRNRSATQVRQASFFVFDRAFPPLARPNFGVECRLNDSMRYGVGFDLIEFIPSVNDPTWNRYRGDSDEDHCA